MNDTMNDTMNATGDEACEPRWQPLHVFGRSVDLFTLFWGSVVAALVTLSGALVFTEQPTLVRAWNGWITITLMLTYIAWYPYLIRVSRTQGDWLWRAAPGWLHSAPLYLALTVGLALTAALVVLHSEFLSLIYIDVGAVVMTLNWRSSILPLVALGLLYFVAGSLLQVGVIGLGYNLFAFAMTIGIVASVRALLKERAARERLIGELHAAQRELRRASAREVELAALRERNRLAREMHDSLGHALTLIAVKIEAAQRLQAVDPARATREWEETKALVRASMGELRASLEGLRAPALDEQPLCAALAELARRSDVPVKVTIAPEANTLDRPLQEALYRVAQEALVNINKHAQAHHAWLSLDVQDGATLLEVADDGVGPGAITHPPSGHYGIVGMRERMLARGGALTLTPRPAGGALLRASAPLLASTPESAKEAPAQTPAQTHEEVADARYPHPVG